MPTAAEVREQLTGPGGMFEITTDVVNGVEVQVYKERLPNLRSIPELSILRGEQTFLVYGEEEWSFERFIATANGVGYALRDDAGVGHGDRVAVLSQNNPEWCLTFWGTVTGGAILVGLNGWWKTEEVLYGLQDSGAKVLVADRKRFERIADQLDQCPDLERIYLTRDCDPADFTDVVGDAHRDKLHRFDELMAEPTATFLDTPIDEDDTAVIFYSSGTTGKPKGIMSTHRNMVANLQNTMYNSVAGAMAGGGALPTGETQTVALFTSPLFHVSGCHSTLVVGLLAGLKLVMPVGKFEPEDALRIIQEQKVNVWATVPTMVWRVCEHPDRFDYDTSTVISVAFGGSPSAEELQRKVQETFPNVQTTSNAYGLTESSSVATVNSGDDAKRKPTSVGPPVPTVEIQVIDDRGNPLPTGEVGEICIKGPIIMKGYWNKPEATAETVVDGWLRSGDIGYVDDEGFVFITDRKKDMIIRGGENIYCVEIEERLVQHPAIADAAVIGVPHPELGEEVKAVVQVEPGQQISEAEVKQWVADGLAGFKVPAYVEVQQDNLPRNASGKLLKNVLRGEGEVSFEETM
ncbi:MAG TPA: class I adenylate-forming enzyme family protein [Acidimicrobiales bacterium]|nr:class I adenylate-forming enzyme family protein [Acidimicrobiales bacterium]